MRLSVKNMTMWLKVKIASGDQQFNFKQVWQETDIIT